MKEKHKYLKEESKKHFLTRDKLTLFVITINTSKNKVFMNKTLLYYFRNERATIYANMKMENTAIYIRKSEERSYSTYIIYIYKHFYSSNQIYYENDFSIHGCLYSLTYVQLLR